MADPANAIRFAGSRQLKPGSRIGDTVEIAGMRCRVVSEGEGEKASGSRLPAAHDSAALP